MESKFFYVYKVFHEVDKSVVFVDITTMKKLSEKIANHKKQAKTYLERPIYKHMNKEGIDNYAISLVETLKDLTKEQIKNKIEYWHKELKALIKVTDRAKSTP